MSTSKNKIKSTKSTSSSTVSSKYNKKNTSTRNIKMHQEVEMINTDISFDPEFLLEAKIQGINIQNNVTIKNLKKFMNIENCDFDSSMLTDQILSSFLSREMILFRNSPMAKRRNFLGIQYLFKSLGMENPLITEKYPEMEKIFKVS